MNRRDRRRRLSRRRSHVAIQRAKKALALDEATAAARRARKGHRGVIAEMRKRGYAPTRTGWRRLVPEEV